MREALNKAQKKGVSPKGTAIFPYLNKPDVKYDAEGVYTTALALEGDDIEEMEKRIAPILRAAKEAAETEGKKKRKKAKEADMPFRPELTRVDPESDEIPEETGRVLFRFKSKASGKRKDGSLWERKVALFDSKGKPMNALVGGGSVLKISYTLVPWVNPKLEYGVKLQLEAVQVITLGAMGGNQDAEGFGFGEEEGGFEADENDAPFDADDAGDPGAQPPEEDEDF